jgi:hypothetical protein
MAFLFLVYLSVFISLFIFEILFNFTGDTPGPPLADAMGGCGGRMRWADAGGTWLGGCGMWI